MSVVTRVANHSSHSLYARKAKKLGVDVDVFKLRLIDTPKPGGLRRFLTSFTFARVAIQKIQSTNHPIGVLTFKKKSSSYFLIVDSKWSKCSIEEETAAGERSEALRQQLHMMRDCRNEELNASKRFSVKVKDQ